MIKIRPKPKNLQLCENGPSRKYKCWWQTPPNTVYLLGKFHWFFVHMFDYAGGGSIHQMMWILSMQGLLPTPWMLWLETGWRNASYHYFIPCVWQSFFKTIRFAKATGTAELIKPDCREMPRLPLKMTFHIFRFWLLSLRVLCFYWHLFDCFLDCFYWAFECFAMCNVANWNWQINTK